MLATQLLVSVLAGLAANASNLRDHSTHFTTNQRPDLTSLRYVYAFFRHGVRSPLYTPYPTDPNKSSYRQYFPGSPGELTKIGKKEMYEVGKKLRDRYGTFVGGYTEEKVYVSSTNTSRTMMTALSVMAGLFPPSRPIFNELKWQPIPVWHDTSDLDKAYIYNDDDFPILGFQVCPRYGGLIKVGYDIIVQPDVTKGRHLLYKLLQNFTGNNNVNSVNTLYKVWDTLQFESLNGLPLPTWATIPQPRYKNKPLYPNIMEPIMVEWFLDTEYLFKNEEMLSFYSGPLFNSIHEHFQRRLKHPHLSEKIRLHATHDTTLFALLWALGLKQPFTVGPGDGILFELHGDSNTPIVKIFYYDANHGHTLKELIFPLCPPPCSLIDFIKNTPGLTPQQWQRMCTM